jgi:hypothetical protein
MVAISLWYNFYFGIVLAVTRRDDTYLDSESLNNISIITPRETYSIQSLLTKPQALTNRPGHMDTYKITRDPSTTEPWSTYIPIFMYLSAMEVSVKIGWTKYPHVFGINISDTNTTATAPLGHEHLEDTEDSTTQDGKRKTTETFRFLQRNIATKNLTMK